MASEPARRAGGVSRPILVLPFWSRRTKKNRRANAPRSPRYARSTVLWFAFALVAGHLVLAASMAYLFPRLRDPEYGRKLDRMQSRVAERPGRPLVVALGSSRVAMGLRPEVVEASGSNAVVFNHALIGSGPVMELMCLRRLLADGVRPDSLVIEVWAPFLYQEGHFREEVRIDVNRVRRDDLPTLRPYLTDPEKLDRETLRARLSPWHSHRFYLMSLISPGWLPFTLRRDFAFMGMDAWGWMPANAGPVTDADRDARFLKAIEYYGAFLPHWVASPDADRALRELVALCREQGIPAKLIVLPESARFRTIYSDESRVRAEAYYRDLPTWSGLECIDARKWLDESDFIDGFHLTAEGAKKFSEQFARKVLP